MAKIHSIQSFGTVDGPGIRTVIFFQGCPLTCQFCHNIDCALPENGTEYKLSELVNEVMKNSAYWQNGKGGVTCSGGEPTFQPQFLVEFCKALSQREVHVAVDSCSLTSKSLIKKLLPYVDLWMLSFKHYDGEVHKQLTGVENKIIKANILALDRFISESEGESESEGVAKRQIRIRFLVVPGITDDREHISQVAAFANQIENFEGVEVLPYGSHGKFKWEEMFGEYPLDHVPDATKEDVDRVKEWFKDDNAMLLSFV